MKVELIDVTPDYAEALLANNGHNRKLTMNRSRALAAAMRSGAWQLNGETVIISESGKLLDGQHRLKAVTIYGQPVQMLVATGANDSAFSTIDTGKTRSAGDILSMWEIKNPTACAAAAKLVWQLLHREPLTTPAPPAYLLKVIERYPAIAKWASRANGLGVRTIVPQGTLIAGLTYLEDIAQKPATAEDFYIGLTEGANLGDGSPILALRNRLINVRSSSGRMDAIHAWPIVAKAISYFEASQKVSKLRYTKSGSVTEAPDLFDVHVSHLTPSQRLVDLLPPEAR